MKHPSELHGEEWHKSITESVTYLLSSYQNKFSNEIPVNLYRLAALNDTRIEIVNKLEGEARLLPINNGFLILVNENEWLTRNKRCRTAIAHELAHTIFYNNVGGVPTRMFKSDNREEQFCFDVGRRLLAPEWLIKKYIFPKLPDVQLIFNKLHEEFKISRPVIARIMLQDYPIASGIANAWELINGKWIPKKGLSLASPNLPTELKKKLKEISESWLINENKVFSPWLIIDQIEDPKKSAYIMVISPLSN